MPKEIAHILFSDFSLSKIKNTTLYNILSQNKNEYNFGSLSTDTFYHNIKLPFQKNFFQWGDLVHGAEGNNTSIHVVNFLKDLKENPNQKMFDKKLALICGFVTHMALDINFHPYVYYFSGNYYDKNIEERKNARIRHRLIESWIDIYFLKQNKLDLYNLNSINQIFSDSKTNLYLLNYLSKFFQESFNTKEDLYLYLKRGYFIQVFLNKYIYKNLFLYKVLKILNFVLRGKMTAFISLFYPNQSAEIPKEIVFFEKFIHPVTGEEYSGNVDSLISNALDMSEIFLNVIEKYIFRNGSFIELQETIKGYSLDVGLEGSKVQDCKYFKALNINIF